MCGDGMGWLPCVSVTSMELVDFVRVSQEKGMQKSNGQPHITHANLTHLQRMFSCYRQTLSAHNPPGLCKVKPCANTWDKEDVSWLACVHAFKKTLEIKGSSIYPCFISTGRIRPIDYISPAWKTELSENNFLMWKRNKFYHALLITEIFSC